MAGAQYTAPASSRNSVGSFGSIDTSNGNWFAFQLGGTWVAKLVVEGSYDNVNWDTLAATSGFGSTQSPITQNGHYTAKAIPPYTRIRVTSYTSGTINLLGGTTVADTSPLSVRNTPATGNVFSLTSAASTNATLIKDGPGSIYEVDVSNLSGSTVYLKLYNKASAPTVGTDVPMITIPVAAGAVYVQSFGGTGKPFTTGIAYAVTGAAASTDTTAIGAGVLVSGSYL